MYVALIVIPSDRKNLKILKTMKTLFDTRPLKEEAWLKCKDNLDSNQMSGLEAIVEGKGLPNAFRRVHLEQVIRFMISELKWRQEKNITNALNVTENFTLDDDEAKCLAFCSFHFQKKWDNAELRNIHDNLTLCI